MPFSTYRATRASHNHVTSPPPESTCLGEQQGPQEFKSSPSSGSYSVNFAVARPETTFATFVIYPWHLAPSRVDSKTGGTTASYYSRALTGIATTLHDYTRFSSRDLWKTIRELQLHYRAPKWPKCCFLSSISRWSWPWRGRLCPGFAKIRRRTQHYSWYYVLVADDGS